MAFGNVPRDTGTIPIAEVYPPGSSGNFAALQGSTNTTTDAAGNVSSPANFNLTQVGSTTFALGQAAMASSVPVAIASDQSNVPTNIAQINGHTPTLDNTTILATSMRGKNSTAGDTAIHVNSGGDQYVLGDFTEQVSLSAGSLNADLVPSTDVSAYKAFSLHINTNAYSGTLTFQGSNDNSNWISIECSNLGTGSNVLTTSSTNILIGGACNYRYLRVRMTGYASGSAQGTLELYTTIFEPVGMFASQSGTWTVQQGNTPATTPWLVTGSNNNGTQAANTAGNTVIKGSAGILQGCLVTATGTANLLIYDNASTNSGTVVAVIPSTATLGQLFPVNGWCKNGITSAGVLNCPGVTFFYA